MIIILETAVGSRKSAQALDAPEKFEKALITNKVTTRFSNSPCTSISCTSFSRPTAVSRIIRPLAIAILSLVLGTAPLHAQQATDEPERDAKETRKNQESPTADKPATAPATNNDSPFDYRPSEEISEDLSVSFPVDI